MKRFFISTIALIVAVTACTESGLIDAPQFYNSEILFDTYIGKAPVTKAENIDLTYLETSSVGGAHLYAFMCDKGNRNISNVDFSSAYLDGRLKCTTPTNTAITFSADISTIYMIRWDCMTRFAPLCADKHRPPASAMHGKAWAV